MQAQPKTKHQELVDKLSFYIDTKTPIEAFVAADIQHEIGSLPPESRSYVTALLKVALKDHDAAVEWFKDAMMTSGDNSAIVAGNYVGYLSCSGHNLFHRMEVFRLVDVFCTQRIRKMARNAAYCIGNDRLVKKYTVMMKALLDGEERDSIEREGAQMAEAIVKFKEATELTSSEIEQLCDAAEQIANNHGVNCIGIEYFLSGGYDNAIILFAETEDSDTLTTMNLELVDLLAHDTYIDRPFTSWFKSAEMKGAEL
ncbi:TPA: hypothetical protein PRR39_002044 [Escherichia coli]|jgi:hypothetical protein|uniref:hypothetical protein n=2 Tax=Escherichia coli TaxID=562 RepID=UPI000B3ED3B4|nr:hypothetical protein [Escherichia coli]EAC2092354.1 hypothetical protein [Escherichia coli]EEW1485192.1 hypothetical protein [Escherichia coli]EFE7997136.1 hypothetical protein [Escherichia coli]EFH3984156.1 hypothetical protein [Escherichia coli]EFH4259245.1 hypothetical protein [Escherichia coli]